MQEGKTFARLLGVVIALPVSGLMALSSAGAAIASTCPTGYVTSIAGNGVEFCAPKNEGVVASGGSATTGSGAPILPGQVAPIVGDVNVVPTLPPADHPSVPPVSGAIPSLRVIAVPPLSSPVVPEASPVKSDKTSSGEQPAAEQASPSETEAGQDDPTAPVEVKGIKMDVLPLPAPTSHAVTPKATDTPSSPEPTGSTMPSIKPDKSSINSPFNPSNIYMGVLSGLLVVLVAALVMVLKTNKKLARK